ncbi:hypothetical protein Xph01_56880 [Micromonospora phaseoli]|nr:hypothetical protein Xph01_56880 [Micromonospora phaseoli]
MHVHALTGNLTDGRSAVTGMRRVADELPDSDVSKVAGPIQRTASFHSYLECRIGSMKEAERAFTEAEPVLRPVPVWLADARIHYGRAMVTHGDTARWSGLRAGRDQATTPRRARSRTRRE